MEDWLHWALLERPNQNGATSPDTAPVSFTSPSQGGAVTRPSKEPSQRTAKPQVPPGEAGMTVNGPWLHLYKVRNLTMTSVLLSFADKGSSAFVQLLRAPFYFIKCRVTQFQSCECRPPMNFKLICFNVLFDNSAGKMRDEWKYRREEGAFQYLGVYRCSSVVRHLLP